MISDEVTEECCGIPMMYYEVFGVRIYMCRHRSHHSHVYVNLSTGQRTEEDVLDVHYQEVEK